MAYPKHSTLTGDELHTPDRFPVADYAAMIALTGMNPGDFCFVTSEKNLYFYDGTEWCLIPKVSPTSGLDFSIYHPSGATLMRFVVGPSQFYINKTKNDGSGTFTGLIQLTDTQLSFNNQTYINFLTAVQCLSMMGSGNHLVDWTGNGTFFFNFHDFYLRSYDAGDLRFGAVSGAGPTELEAEVTIRSGANLKLTGLPNSSTPSKTLTLEPSGYVSLDVYV